MVRIAMVAVATLMLASPALADDSKRDKPADEKLICKKETQIGSLARVRKQCFTKAEWDRIAVANRTLSDDLVDRNRSRTSY